MRTILLSFLLFVQIALPVSKERIETCYFLAKIADECAYIGTYAINPAQECSYLASDVQKMAIQVGLSTAFAKELRKLCQMTCLSPASWELARTQALSMCINGR